MTVKIRQILKSKANWTSKTKTLKNHLFSHCPIIRNIYKKSNRLFCLHFKPICLNNVLQVTRHRNAKYLLNFFMSKIKQFKINCFFLNKPSLEKSSLSWLWHYIHYLSLWHYIHYIFLSLCSQSSHANAFRDSGSILQFVLIWSLWPRDPEPNLPSKENELHFL